jgi:uncharacterized DUF497 family protein
MSAFEWDSGNWPKCGKHGVSKTEIEAVFRTFPLVLADGSGGAEARFRAVGRTESGRYVFVVFTYREQRIRPISARYMHQKEGESYDRQTGA